MQSSRLCFLLSCSAKLKKSSHQLRKFLGIIGLAMVCLTAIYHIKNEGPDLQRATQPPESVQAPKTTGVSAREFLKFDICGLVDPSEYVALPDMTRKPSWLMKQKTR